MSYTILALDTVTNACSVALSHNNNVYKRHIVEPRIHSKALLPTIMELTTEAGIALADLDYIAIDKGPGSFVGARLGMGVAQGIAYANDIQIIPISSLEIIRTGADDAQNIIPVLDAQMGGVYCQYPESAEILLQTQVEFTQKLQQIKDFTLIGPDLPRWLQDACCGEILNHYPHAADLLKLAAQNIPLAVPPHQIEPIYLRSQA